MDETFDSLDDALHALVFAFAEDLHETGMRTDDARAAAQPDTAKISRLGGYDIVGQYAMGQFMDMRNRFSDAGLLISALHDDPSRLPELMDGVLGQLKAMRGDGRLMKSAMVLLPSMIPDVALDRDAVARGADDALEWMEKDLFPLFLNLCPPRVRPAPARENSPARPPAPPVR